VLFTLRDETVYRYNAGVLRGTPSTTMDFRLQQGEVKVNQQDKSFLTVFTAIMGVLVLIAVAVFLIARLVSTVVTYEGDDGSRQAASVEKRLAPVGRVVVAGEEGAEEAAPAAADLTGEQVVGQVCAACHQSGVLQAPKIGSKEDWQPRLDKGLDALVGNAINGLNAMPPRGGNANLSDDLIREATLYMLVQSGIEVEGGSAAASEGGQDQTGDAATDDADRGISGEPTKTLTTEDTEEPSAAAPAEDAGEPPAATGSDVDVEKGKELYGQSCFACHATGAANAPKLGDKAAWEPRIAQGEAVLVEHAIKGFNGMPPKGGAMQLNDDDIKNIVAYMIQSVQ